MPYLVISWQTDEILSEHRTLAIAARYARGKGHTGVSAGTWYLACAFVSDGTMVNGRRVCVYNPRFSTKIGEVGQLINSQPPDNF